MDNLVYNPDQIVSRKSFYPYPQFLLKLTTLA